MTASAPVNGLGALWQRSKMGITVVRDASAPTAPAEWRAWLKVMFPSAVSKPMAPHHEVLWNHVWAIDYPDSPRPFVAVWSREGGKSTNVELACVALGVRGARRYIGYVRSTQSKADDSVTNIATKLESETVAMHYPPHGRKLLSKFGHSRGWKRNRVRTEGGFTVEAFGLDVASRGAKLGDLRPDVWVFDDIDEDDDTPHATAAKIKIITRNFLPAGSERCAVIAVQNLINPDGVFTQIVDGRADFLSDRVVSGPHKAVLNLVTEKRDITESGTTEDVIVSGTPTWEGQSLEICQRQINRWGLRAFKLEAQHEVKERAEGIALNFDELEHFEDLTDDEVKQLVQVGNNFGGIDFQYWRFGFVVLVADEHGVVHRIDELFSQREELSVRAARIHSLCESRDLVRGDRFLRPFPIWGDSANPTDIAELNAAWRAINSPLRVIGVGGEGKLRRASVDRINDKLGTRALRFVRSVGASHRWLLGYNAGNPGTPTKGSRLMWEIGKWSYPVPPDGKVDLNQDPSDHTADGADMIAALRYALMSWWRPGKPQDESDVDVNAPEILKAEIKTVYTLRGRRTRSRTTHRRYTNDDE